jgi:pyridoxamine 5'-phosphate oxidase
VLHWKSLRRQIRVRGHVTREEGPQADAYFSSRSLKSRIGAWASQQSQPLTSREALMAEAAKLALTRARIRRARRSGAVSGFDPSRSNSGPTAPSGCMTGFAGIVPNFPAEWQVTRLNP